ncbi:type II CRISPR RNA-guided endonuclease Cas9 [Helicobacter sp. MIT 01-3238]|uniref:type II CRISPR RNA-guided endonuclease Cas9 n=1 Tax=Helicobacter sp. MIT 01-3238 TaxID=398627 RepID=UPI0038CFC57F
MKILGFDIGVASIGWAFVEGGELKDCGVRIFTKAENPKDGSSLALPRREARGVRRRLARRKGRLNALKVLICKEFGLNRGDYLANAGELPKAYHTSKDTKSPYQLRAESLNRKLSADEFARVILHIAKHRGYGNKHAKESNDDDSGKVKKAISENQKVMSEKGYTTAGQYLYGEFYQKERNEQEIQARVETLKAYYKSNKVKVENQNKNKLERQSPNQFNNIRNKSENYARCLAQSELQKELEIIFERQKQFGFEFSDKKHKIIDANGKLQELDFADAVLEIAFLQRPLKSLADKVGKCTFYESEPRAPKDSLSAIEFVALTRIINTLANITKRSGEVYSADKVREILSIVLDKGEITYKNLRKVIALDEKLQFPKDSKLDYAKEDAEKAKAIEFSKLKAFRKALGGSFEGFSRAELDSIATDIALTKSKDELKAKLANYQSLNDEQREKLSELSFDKFIDLSFKALEAILPLMRGDSGECKRYDEAWREAGLVEVAKKTQKGDSLPPLIQYEQNLANPVVARALAEYRKVLNALLKKHGKVHKIHLEFTRQAGVSSKERGEIIAEQNKRLKANEEARKRCEEYGLIPSGKNILKLKLWQEQGEFCVYSGKKICREHFLDPKALEVEHIYPYSRSYDDSQNNKVLVFADANQNKREKTPYEAFGGDTQKWNQILGRIEKLPKAKKNRITNKNFANKEAGFIARNIVDTSYIATLTASYTDAFIEFLPLTENEDTTLGRGEKGSKKHISVVNGSLTATMRHYWGLNTLLDSEDSEKKDRSNHLHHALDAIIIAYVNDSVIKAFSDFKKTQEQNKAHLIAKEIESAEYKISRRFFAPSGFENNEAFRQAIKRKILGQSRESRENDMSINSEAMGEKVGGIFVSKPPRKRARGALHKETFKSPYDEKVYKDFIDNKKLKELEKLKQDKPKEFLEFIETAVNRAIKLGKVRQIGSKIADNGTMVRVDIFRHKVSGKFYGVPIYTMDFALGILPNKAVVGGKDKSGVIKDWLEMDSNYEFCFSLFKDDLILVQKKEMSKAELCYFMGFGIATASISVEKHDNHFDTLTENQKLLFSNATPKEVKGLSIGIQNLKVFEKWQVSPLGEVSKAGFKEREPIALKSTPKRFLQG